MKWTILLMTLFLNIFTSFSMSFPFFVSTYALHFSFLCCGQILDFLPHTIDFLNFLIFIRDSPGSSHIHRCKTK